MPIAFQKQIRIFILSFVIDDSPLRFCTMQST